MKKEDAENRLYTAVLSGVEGQKPELLKEPRWGGRPQQSSDCYIFSSAHENLIFVSVHRLPDGTCAASSNKLFLSHHYQQAIVSPKH